MPPPGEVSCIRPFARLWRSYRELCVALAVSFSGGCAGPAVEAVQSNVTELLQTRHGLIMVVNPTNCTLTLRDVERINALAARRHLSVTVVFRGLLIGDTATAQRARLDLGLTVPALLGSDIALTDLWSGVGADLPLFAVVRSGIVKAVIGGLDTDTALDAVYTLLEVNP